MNGTSPEIARMVCERYADMEPVQRFLIGVSMFEAARAIALESVAPGLSPLDLRGQLCDRLYPRLAADACGTGDGEEMCTPLA